MVEANPYANQTLEIYETALPTGDIPDDIRGIRITHEPKYVYGPTPEVRAISAWLRRVPRPEAIATFQIDYESALTEVPDVRGFVNLEYAHLAGRFVQRYEPVYALDRLKGLFLVSYKRADLSDFARLDLERFRAIRGRLVRLDLAARSVHLQKCSALEEFGDVKIEHLTIESCKRINLETIPRIVGLRHLALEGLRSVPSLDFINGCESLERLAITGNPLTKTDVSALYTKRVLQKAFLGSASQRLLREIGARNPELYLTNGQFSIHRGEVVRLQW